MTKLEEIARAIWDVSGCCHGMPSIYECTYMQIDGNCDCMEQVRAAVKAMREPTSKMCTRAWDESDRDGLSPDECWRFMIDAILSEKG